MELNDFDLAKFASSGAKLELYHPKEFMPLKDVIDPSTGENFDPIFIDVLGHDSKEYVDAIREEGRFAKDSGTIDPLESQQRIFAAMVVGWSGITKDGEAFEYSKKNSILMLEDFNWIAVQVKTFCEDRANFFLSAKSITKSK